MPLNTGRDIAGPGRGLKGIVEAAGRALSAVPWPRWGGTGLGGVNRLFLPGARFDYEREAGDLWMNSTLAIALQWLSDRFPKAPLRVCRIDDRTGRYVPLPRHPLVDLWNRPNPYETRRSMEIAVGLSLVCDGNGHLQKVRDKTGTIRELWWVPFFDVGPMWPSDGSEFLSDWQVWAGDHTYDVPARDMVHFKRGVDPRNRRLGMSATKAQLREVCGDNEVSAFHPALLRNGAVPSLMIVPDDEKLKVVEKDATKIKEKIHDRFTGEERGNAVVLAGKYKVVPVGWSPEQLALDKLPQLMLAKLGASVGVPLMAMGMPDPGKTYANVEQAIKIGWGAVQGIQELNAEVLRWQLLPEFGTDPYKHVVEYDYSNVAELQESLDSLHTRAREDYKAGVITRNEARDRMGEEPDPDGDLYYPGTGGGDPLAPPAPEPTLALPPPDGPKKGVDWEQLADWRY